MTQFIDHVTMTRDFSLILLSVVEVATETKYLGFRTVYHVVFPASALLDSESSPFVFSHKSLGHPLYLKLNMLNICC